MISRPSNLGLKSLKVIQTCIIRKFGCSFLFAFHSNYGSILHHLRDKVRYWSKNVIFSYPPLHSAPPLGGPRWNTAVWCGKTRMVWLPDGSDVILPVKYDFGFFTGFLSVFLPTSCKLFSCINNVFLH